MMTERHSDEMNQVVNKPPTWILSYGAAFLMAILLAVSAVFGSLEYPDLIKVQLNISTENRPQTVIASQPGVIRKVSVMDNQFVDSGQVLAYLENSYTSKSELLKKKFEYSICSPCAGTVRLIKEINEGSSLKIGQTAFIILSESKDVCGEISVSNQMLRVLKFNQIVKINRVGNLKNKDVQIEGRLISFKKVLGKPNVTNVQIALDYKTGKVYRKLINSGNSVDIEIVTDKRSFFTRFFGRLLN